LTDESFSILRKTLDGKETYVGSHQVIKTAGATLHAARMKRIPVWALDDNKIKEFIESRFPQARTNPRQRRLAARMLRLIYLYYRVGETNVKIAEELNMTLNAVDCAIHRINKAMKRELKRVGRPKKNTDSIETSSEVSF
jgi:hypothetical protein